MSRRAQRRRCVSSAGAARRAGEPRTACGDQPAGPTPRIHSAAAMPQHIKHSARIADRAQRNDSGASVISSALSNQRRAQAYPVQRVIGCPLN